MANEKTLSELQLDAIGEIMNISMGSAATAVSELLNAKVWITTPQVSSKKVKELNYTRLEPAICVKIVYVKGMSGSNLMILKQEDVELILNQLMGQPLTLSDDFEFDELNISAVSEVMNQMMGASATALSDFLSMPIDISTPTPYILDNISLSDLQEANDDDDIVAINFDLTIDGVIKSEFISVMSFDLARGLSDNVLNMGSGAEEDAQIENPVPTPQQTIEATVQRTQPQVNPVPQVQPQGQAPSVPQAAEMPAAPQQIPYGYPQQPYGYPAPPPYGYPQQPPAAPINVQDAHLHQFDSFDVNLTGKQQGNLELLMNVPLQITVEIGKAKKKVKEILEFQQGTIIELERQAGAPVDVIVNGNLIARGDVVVIDDNFAVRITEIVKSKFIDSLGKE